jgi:hypothetical protein
MYLVTNLAPKLLLIYDKYHMIGAISHILEYYFLMITSSVVVTAFHYEISLTEVRWCLFKKKILWCCMSTIRNEISSDPIFQFIRRSRENKSLYNNLSFSVWELSCK